MLWSALRLPNTDDPPSPTDAALQALAVWALQFTPRVAVAEEAVLLEVGASLRLFGGRAALRERLWPGACELGAVAHDESYRFDVPALARTLGDVDPTQPLMLDVPFVSDARLLEALLPFDLALNLNPPLGAPGELTDPKLMPNLDVAVERLARRAWRANASRSSATSMSTVSPRPPSSPRACLTSGRYRCRTSLTDSARATGPT